jgi:hypothetical protein
VKLKTKSEGRIPEGRKKAEVRIPKGPPKQASTRVSAVLPKAAHETHEMHENGGEARGLSWKQARQRGRGVCTVQARLFAGKFVRVFRVFRGLSVKF